MYRRSSHQIGTLRSRSSADARGIVHCGDGSVQVGRYKSPPPSPSPRTPRLLEDGGFHHRRAPQREARQPACRTRCQVSARSWALLPRRSDVFDGKEFLYASSLGLQAPCLAPWRCRCRERLRHDVLVIFLQCLTSKSIPTAVRGLEYQPLFGQTVITLSIPHNPHLLHLSNPKPSSCTKDRQTFILAAPPDIDIWSADTKPLAS